jgi:hypothetical protein
MERPHRPNRCDALLTLIDECLADYERTSAARTNRRRPSTTEVLS